MIAFDDVELVKGDHVEVIGKLQNNDTIVHRIRKI